MSTTTEQSQLAMHTALIVDDDKFLLDMYVLKFKQSGFEVTACLGAEDALERLRAGLQPDVILTDILMPSMDGFSFLERMKEEKLALHAKKIVLSNKGEKPDIDRAASSGAVGYVIKASVIPSEVVEKARTVLGLK
ncbi:MAG: response regulator [Candidatus Yonathbacteria bacterium]|nr:response regulator [Candidatus Yonathbacteria bacterium]NTW47458.1 response regulator [Candidatus Yonathbacteria bacterium]